MRLGRQARSQPATPFSPEYSLSHCLWARPERKGFFKLRFKSDKIHLLLLKISISQIALDVDMTYQLPREYCCYIFYFGSLPN